MTPHFQRQTGTCLSRRKPKPSFTHSATGLWGLVTSPQRAYSNLDRPWATSRHYLRLANDTQTWLLLHWRVFQSCSPMLKG